MNPNAGSWTPGGAAPTPAAPPRTESSVSDVDESDPLWQCVLRICEGDRARALKLINDPDSLTKYPEVEALIAAGDGDAATIHNGARRADGPLCKTRGARTPLT